VKSKITFILSYELLFLLLVIICLVPSGILYATKSLNVDPEGNPIYGNSAGMDANIALVGIYLLIYAIHNIIFFPWFYKHPDKFTVPFFTAFIVASVLGCLIYFTLGFIPATATIFDALTSTNWYYQLIFTAGCTLIFVLLTILTYKLSIKHFSKVDI
ncbi:MAG: hypothetical protein WC174_05105, partial [Bacilli bacterium]